MIEVTRLRGSKVVLNAELIETIEETPDTVITLTSGKRYIVSESSDELVSRVIEYKRKIYNNPKESGVT
jgi:flagellar protein FlbD